MTIAEIQGLLRLPRIATGDSTTLPQIAKITLMRGKCMVAVDAIFDQQLPVGANAIRLRSFHYFHPNFRLIAYQVQILFGAGEVFIQILGRRIEADKDKSAIAIHSRRLCKTEFLPVKSRLAVRIVAGNADQFTALIVCPRMVRALERLRVAGTLTAYERAAMGAGVQQHSHFAIVPPYENQRTACDPARTEIARPGHLRLVAGVDPAILEDSLPLDFQAFRFGERAPIHAENSPRLIVDYELVQRYVLHDARSSRQD